MCLISSLFRIMVLVVCAATSATNGEQKWRRFIMDQSHSGFGPGWANPGGDPLHQGGNAKAYTQYQQGPCVTPQNPCRCSMNYVADLGCLHCNCQETQNTVLVPVTPKSALTTTSRVAMTTTVSSTIPTTRSPATSSTKPTTPTQTSTSSSTTTPPSISVFPTTMSPKTTTQNTTPTTTTLLQTTMTTKVTTPNPKITTTLDYCDVAKQLCQSNCQDGFLVDPGDCTFCVCKRDAMSG